MSEEESFQTMIPNRIDLALGAALFGLAACGPLVQIGGNTAAPAALLTLRAEVPSAPAPTRPGATLLIALPGVPGALQTLRLPVATSDTEVQYLKDGSWIEQPARLFQRLLIDTVAAKTGMIAFDGRNTDLAPARKLGGKLLDFGLDVRSSPMVRVRYDAVLTSANGKLLAARSFTASQPVGSQSPTQVAAALNLAGNGIAAEVADWVAAESAGSSQK